MSAETEASIDVPALFANKFQVVLTAYYGRLSFSEELHDVSYTRAAVALTLNDIKELHTTLGNLLEQITGENNAPGV